MRHVLVALLLVGCISSSKPIPPKTDAAIAKTLATATKTLSAMTGVVQLICETAGEGTDVCVSLSHSLSMVAFATEEARKLYATYQQTGVGLELVHAAVDRIYATLEHLHDNTMMARQGYGIDAPIASAYCSRCCGVVVEPKAGAAAPAAPNPYRDLKPAPATKAP